MPYPQKNPKVMHFTLWAAQILLAATLIWAGSLKLFQPIEELAAMWPWAVQVPSTFVKFTGLVDLLAAVGLTLPALLGIQPKLTPIAAVCIVVLMLCASIFHIIRGEVSVIGVNVVFAVLAAFIAWGRFTKAPIASK